MRIVFNILKLKNIKEPFDLPSIHPHNNTRPSGALGVRLSLDPEGRLKVMGRAFNPLQF